jgi:hypothetical protein
MRWRLWFVHVVLWYEVAFSVVVVLVIGSYLFGQLGTIRFALPADTSLLAAILMLSLGVRQLVALVEIDYAGPVVAIQRRLAELRLARARSNRWFLLSVPMLWALAIIVVPHGLVGFDIYRTFGLPFVAGNLIVGVAVLAAAAWVTWRFPAASRSSAFLRWLGEDFTGDKVAAASALLDDIVAFEAEGGAADIRART